MGSGMGQKRPGSDWKDVQQLAASGQSSSSNESALRQAILQVVSIWLNRLSLVSGIASFFASIDSLLFSLASTSTHLGDPTAAWSATDKLTTASFAGALIFHVCSAILAFVGSFILVRLQLIDADDQEAKITVTTLGGPLRFKKKPAQNAAHLAVENNAVERPSTSSAADPEAPSLKASDASTSDPTNAVYCRVTVECTHPLYFLSLPTKSKPAKTPTAQPVDALLDPPIALLSRCHTLAVWMSALGFLLGVIGILAYAWVATPLAVSIFSTACLGGCLLVGVIAVW